MSKIIRIDDDVYQALLDLKYKRDTMSHVIGKMLAKMGIEPFDEEFEDELDDE